MARRHPLRVASLFSGAGGLDLGFERALDGKGFHVVWANEYDKSITPTFRKNFPATKLIEGSIADLTSDDLDDGLHSLLPSAGTQGAVAGLLGGPPCQSWSEAGARRGSEDPRGQLFFEYIRILRLLKPAFFLAENVSGILFERHKEALARILEEFRLSGYNVYYAKLNAVDYEVPEDRERVIFVGFRSDLPIETAFSFPAPVKRKKTLEVIRKWSASAKPFDPNNRDKKFQNEWMEGGFSPIFLSRNRVRDWHEPSFTVQATARHAPIHPSAGIMTKAGTDRFVFAPGAEKKGLVRRLTVREAAEVQTFPSNFTFDFSNIVTGYKMVGNAVPVKLAEHLASAIFEHLQRIPTELLVARGRPKVGREPKYISRD
jgi:DNA (cytosine-5)-methyltransferase 1